MAENQEIIVKPTTKFVARNAAELSHCQEGLYAWANQRMEEMQAEIAECEQQEAICLEHGWASEPWKRRKRLAVKRHEYYEKCRAALDAGFVIVPNMPIQNFAVRTTKERPEKQTSTWRSPVASSNRPALGEGQYVSSDVALRSFEVSEPSKDCQGNPRTKIVEYFEATDFRDIDFPVDVAEPVIMEKVGAALREAIFDEIGVCRDTAGGRGDPFVIGRILDPRPNRTGLSFFIAWNLDVTRL